MEKYSVLNDTLYYDSRTSVFLLQDDEEALKELQTIETRKIAENLTKNNKVYTFCLNISNGCNLNCAYCFNKTKNGKSLSYENITSFLDEMFLRFNDGVRYVVDLSGKGEPLLNLKLIFKIADYCKELSNKFRVEVLVQFVCNGTLLTKKIVKQIQDKGILFGISIDGNKQIHDRNRKTKFGFNTFDAIISNVSQIEHREFLGCACTLTNNTFSLIDSINYLSKYFTTISYKPCRGNFLSNESELFKWKFEYSLLAQKMLNEFKNDNISTFKLLMNGDDYFGKFLCRAFGRMRTFGRCDAGITRFALDTNGDILTCAPSTQKLNSSEIEKQINEKIKNEINKCSTCSFKTLCGGYCELLEKSERELLCDLNKHLICLAQYLFLKSYEINEELCKELSSFVINKTNYIETRTKTLNLMKSNPNLTFNECKEIVDKERMND